VRVPVRPTHRLIHATESLGGAMPHATMLTVVPAKERKRRHLIGRAMR